MSSIALQADGKIVVGGLSQEQTEAGSLTGVAVVRYNTNGSLDSTFGTGGEIVASKYGSLKACDEFVAIDGSGRIYAAGYYLLGRPPAVDTIHAQRHSRHDVWHRGSRQPSLVGLRLTALACNQRATSWSQPVALTRWCDSTRTAA